MNDGVCYIQENQISRSISRLRDIVDKIEAVTGRSLRTASLRQEITRLEEQLKFYRKQSAIHPALPLTLEPGD